MTQPAGPDSADWQRCWTIDAGSVTLQPVTRRTAQAVLDGRPITCRFENGALHDRIPQAMGFAICDIDSGAAAVLPTVWLIVRRADGRIVGDLGTHGPPNGEGCVEIGYSLAPSARGQGVGTAAVAALARRLAAVPDCHPPLPRRAPAPAALSPVTASGARSRSRPGPETSRPGTLRGQVVSDADGAGAFSPTEVSAFKRRAKLMMMTEAAVSLVIGILVIARAVNI